MRLIAISLIKYKREDQFFYQFLLRMTNLGRVLYSGGPSPSLGFLYPFLFFYCCPRPPPPWLCRNGRLSTPYLSKRFLGFNCASQRVPLVPSTVAVKESADVVAGLSPISYRPACLLFHPTGLPSFVLMVYLDVSSTETSHCRRCVLKERLSRGIENEKKRKGKG